MLASRKNAGIRVALLWAADTNPIAVLVRDDSTNEQFELLVEPEGDTSVSGRESTTEGAPTMSTLKSTTPRLVGSAAVSPRPSGAMHEPTVAASREALFVIPGRGGGLRASIRGHMLELAEPSLVHQLAPTPDDLFIASIASDLAWSARHFLHAHGLSDDVSVSAEWRRLENPPSLADVSLTVTVPETADAMSVALEDVLAERVAARSVDEAPRLHLRWVG